MSDRRATFRPAGDSGLVVEFGDAIDRATSALVVALEERVLQAKLAGVVETVPTFRSLLVHIDPDVTDLAALEARLAPLLSGLDVRERDARRWTIPACYEGDLAPDLASVAEAAGLTPAQAVEAHAGIEYHVYMVGFLPGFPYLGDIAPALRLPRRSEPRVALPAGSVAIATSLTAVYPVESPGGWHLIGRTPVKLFDPARREPALFRPGDAVRFEPMSLSAYAALEERVHDCRYRLEPDPR